MVINRNTLKINSIDISEYVVEVNFGFYDLYPKEAGRNMKGSMRGTKIGTYPKLTYQFRSMSQTELETIVGLLEQSNKTMTYYDPYKKQIITKGVYRGDYEYTQNNIGRVKGFSCALISNDKR